MQLAPAILTATKNSNGKWQIDYQIPRVQVLVSKLIITGPPGSTVNVYRNYTAIDVSARGDLNSNEFLIPLEMNPGETLTLIWSLGTGNPATATIIMTSRF